MIWSQSKLFKVSASIERSSRGEVNFTCCHQIDAKCHKKKKMNINWKNNNIVKAGDMVFNFDYKASRSIFKLSAHMWGHKICICNICIAMLPKTKMSNRIGVGGT